MRSPDASITGTRPGGRPALGRANFWQRIHVDPWLLFADSGAGDMPAFVTVFRQ